MQFAGKSCFILLLIVLANPVESEPGSGALRTNRVEATIERFSSLPGSAPETVTVVLESRGRRDLSADIAANGGILRHRSGFAHEIRIPASQLQVFLRRFPPDVLARLPYPHSVESITGQGVAVTGAADMHTLANDGSNTRIGVIDLGFSKLSDAQNSGDLPGNLTITDYTGNGSGGGNHGTNVSEIVHDMAPGAELYLARIGSLIQLEQAVDDMIAAGVSVINHSVAWFGVAFYDGSGKLCEITETAENNGILWVNAAGNYRSKHYQATFTDNNGRHDFATGQPYNTVSLSANKTASIILNWDDYASPSVDYDLFLYDGNPDAGGNLVAQSTDNQSAGPQQFRFPPLEIIDYTPATAGTYYIVVEKSGGTSANLPLALFSPNANLGVQTRASSISQPADCDAVLAVGATNVSNDSPRSFSSEGPTTDGRNKPDLSGPDGVKTSLSNSFTGTSGAAPHVAGAAALLQAQNPELSIAQIRDALTTSAEDVSASGYDLRTGHGRLSLDADNDGINHDHDNCPVTADPDQTDVDGDGEGNPCDADDDNDGLPDAEESQIGSNPLVADSDGDGLSDGFEAAYDGTAGTYKPGQDLNPVSVDTDGDGFNDDIELSYNSNPLAQSETPASGDLNEDGAINAADVALAQQISLGVLEPSGLQSMRGDVAPEVDGIPVPDGTINAADVLLIETIALE